MSEFEYLANYDKKNVRLSALRTLLTCKFIHLFQLQYKDFWDRWNWQLTQALKVISHWSVFDRLDWSRAFLLMIRYWEVAHLFATGSLSFYISFRKQLVVLVDRYVVRSNRSLVWYRYIYRLVCCSLPILVVAANDNYYWDLMNKNYYLIRVTTEDARRRHLFDSIAINI